MRVTGISPAFAAVLLAARAAAGISSLPEPIAPVEGKNKPWTDRQLRNAPEDFHFVILSDRCGGCRPGVFRDAVRQVNLLQPEFVICVGDLIEGYTEDEAQMKKQWDELDSIVKSLDMRFFYVPGNHDLSNAAEKKFYRERYGATRYHFTYGNVLFLVLDSQDPPEHAIGDEQTAWVRKVLEENANVRRTFVFLHTPFWARDPVPENWSRIQSLLASRPHTVFAGHEHVYAKRLMGDNRYIMLATTGGVSELGGLKKGEFDHMVWVTVTDKGPVIANLMLSGLLDEDLVEDVGSVRKRVSDGYKVRMTHAFIEGEPPRRLATRVTVANASDVPMEVRLKWRKHGDFRPIPGSRSITVPAAGMIEIDWDLPMRRKLLVEEFGPLILEHRAKALVPGHEPIELGGELAFGFDSMHDCPRIEVPPVIDGNLADWKDLPFDAANPREVGMVPSSWKGPGDAAFRFGVGYDDTHVYVAVSGRDDAGTAKDRSFWQNDAVLVRLNPAERKTRSERMARGEEAKDFVFGQTPYGDMPDYYRSTLPEGTKWACVPAEGGWTAELAIPRAEFKAQEFHLNVGQIDTDGDEEWGTLLYWRPSAPENDFPESGMFRFR